MDELKVELQLTVNEANLILAALSELPYKVSFELIQKINQQAEQQMAASRNDARRTIDESWMWGEIRSIVVAC